MKEIVLQAVPFCYGPASIALAIGGALREQCSSNLKLTAAGQGVALELLRSSGYFDRVLELDMRHLDEPGNSASASLMGADVVVTVADFDLALRLSQFGKPAVMVDPLYWMWDEDPIPSNVCRRYFALDFPGTRERIAMKARARPGEMLPSVVEPVLDSGISGSCEGEPEDGSLVINVGGVQCPLGTNLGLVAASVKRAVGVALQLGLHERVIVCGGRYALEEVRRLLGPLDPRVSMAPLPQEQYLRQVAACKDLASTPGLSSAVEAFRFAKKTLFLLPMNYSQHRQMDVFRRIAHNAHFISWDDITGYGTLPAGLPEERGVELSFELGNRFASDLAAQACFEERFARFLLAPSAGLALKGEEAAVFGTFNGAAQIADWLLTAGVTNDAAVG